MAKVKLGPFSEPQYNDIKSYLDDIDKDHSVEVDENLVRQYQEHIAAKGPLEQRARGTSGFPQVMFVSLNEEALPKVRAFLDNYGLMADPNAQYLEDNEYFCPECDYKANASGLCPTHGKQLVDYFESIKIKKSQADADPVNKFLRYGFMAFILLIIIVLAKKGSQ